MRLTKLFNDFYENAKGGVMLIICTLISLVLANTEARIAILFSSLVIGFIGFIWLRSILKNKMKALLISN